MHLSVQPGHSCKISCCFDRKIWVEILAQYSLPTCQQRPVSLPRKIVGPLRAGWLPTCTLFKSIYMLNCARAFPKGLKLTVRAWWKWKKKDNLAVSFSSLRNNVLGSFASLLTLIVMKYGNMWFNALDLTINTLFILRVEVIVHFLHY